MQIKFVGAIGRVTGSCTWLKYERTGIEFLVDCGMVQGEENDAYENKKSFPFEPCDIKFILLTHAHLDHCGLIPRLYKEGFCGKVYCTSATAKLSKIILLDAAKQSKGLYSKQDVEQIKYHKVDDTPEFRWGKSMWFEDCLQYYFLRSAHILGSASIGLMWQESNCPTNQILFTGDIGNNTEENAYQSLLKYRQKPFEGTKNIVIESTYGNSMHDLANTSFENRIEKLEKEILDTVSIKRGQLIIPAFSLHRTQEIIMDLYYLFAVKWKKNPPKCHQPLRKKVNKEVFHDYIESLEGIDCNKNDLYENNESEYILKEEYKKQYQNSKFLMNIPIHVTLDSMMAKEISKIYAKELCRPTYNEKEKITKYHSRNENLKPWLNMEDAEINQILGQLYKEDLCKIGIHSLKYSKSVSSSNSPEVIVTGSGMCDEGNILKHLQRVLGDSKNTILLTGYQSKGTNGSLLSQLQTMSENEKENNFIKLVEGGKIACCDIRAEIHVLKGYSGHADQKSLLEYLFTNDSDRKYTIPTIFLNHGTNANRNGLKKAIEDYRDYLRNETNSPERFQTNVIWISKKDTIFDLEKQSWIDNSPSDINKELVEMKNMLQLIMDYLGIKLENCC